MMTLLHHRRYLFGAIASIIVLSTFWQAREVSLVTTEVVKQQQNNVDADVAIVGSVPNSNHSSSASSFENSHIDSLNDISSTNVTSISYISDAAAVALPQALPRPVRLLRVPKASSSSFSAFLRLQYDCISDDYPAGDCTAQNQKSCPDIKGCTNHGAPPKELSNAPPMVTVVREPIRRYQSAYHYPGHHGEGTSNIVEHMYLFPEWNNTLTNFLSGASIGTWGNGRGQVVNRPRDSPPDKGVPTPAEMLQRQERALQVVNSSAFTGILEYWDDSLRLFCRLYDCKDLEASLKGKRERYNPKSEKLANATAVTSTAAKDDGNKTTTTGTFIDTAKTKERVALEQAHVHDTIVYQACVTKFCNTLRQFQHDNAFWTSLSTKVKDFCSEQKPEAK